MKEKRFGLFVLEVLAVVAVLCGVVAFCDARGIFNPDDTNNHIAKKWHYLYQYASQGKPVDILVIGNSHAYTGLVPKHIKKTLGQNCFILAAPGSTMDDCRYMLEEALTMFTPKLVVLETYPIYDYDQKRLPAQNLSDQFTSFAARRNFGIKLKSSLRLFRLDDVPFAWSSTLRNHGLIFDDPLLLDRNIHHPGGMRYDPNEDYDGKYSRFTSGLTEKTLSRYRTEGAPVDGSAVVPGKYAVKATGRMVDMCHAKGIPVMFLTIPMYREHVSAAERWHENLVPVIAKLPWLDLQDPQYYALFGPDSFEDTYNANQHLSNVGAVKATDVLAQYIDYLRISGYIKL